MVVVAPVPLMPPGLIVQVPEGKLPRTILPVASEQDGCVIEIISGIGGVPEFATITTLADGNEIHPSALVTV